MVVGHSLGVSNSMIIMCSGKGKCARCVDEHARTRARAHIHSSHQNTETHLCPSLSMRTYALATCARTSLMAFDDSPSSVIWTFSYKRFSVRRQLL
jgi:hypothetical protein